MKVPVRATAQNWHPLVGLVTAIESTPGRMVVDARALERAEPFGTTTLAAAIAYREATGLGPVSILPPADPESAEFLREVGFPGLSTAAGAPSGKTRQTLRMRRLDALDPSYVHHVANLVQRWVPGTPEAAAELIELCFNELLQNVFEHSQSAIGCFAHARWFKRSENVRIAVADCGVGVAHSLRQNPKFAHLSEQELVRTAVETRGATARTTGRYGGFGLKHLRELAVERSGRLTVVSGTVTLQASQGGVRVKESSERFRGTVVEVDFRPGLSPEPTGKDVF